MKHRSKLKKIAQVLNSVADDLEEISASIKIARKTVKEELKKQELILPVETKHTKKGSYLKITYIDQKPNLPSEVSGIEIRVKQKTKK